MTPFVDTERPHRRRASPWMEPPLPSIESGAREPGHPVTERTVTPEEAARLGITIKRPTVQEIADGLAAGKTLAEIAEEHGEELIVVADRANRYKARLGVPEAQLTAAYSAHREQQQAERAEPVPEGEEPEVTFTREQVEQALADHETQRQVARALGVGLPRLRATVEGVGVQWPWQGTGQPRLDRMPPAEQAAPVVDKPEPVPAMAAPEPEPDHGDAYMQGEAELRAESEAAATVTVDTGIKSVMVPPLSKEQLREIMSAAGVGPMLRPSDPLDDGLVIQLPRRRLDALTADKLLAQIRDTITVAGGPVELQLSVRVAVGGRE